MTEPSPHSQVLLETVRRVAESVIPPTDDQLWERVRVDLRDLVAFTELYRRWRSSLVMLARRDGVSPERAEELVNSAFTRLLRVRTDDRYRPTARAFGYLWKCVDRACWRASRADRRRAVRETAAGNAAAAVPPDPDPVARAELVAAVREALGMLSDRQRLAAELHYLFGWAEPQVAEAIGVKSSTVKEHLDRARQKLREALAKWNPTAAVAGGLSVGSVLADTARADSLSPERLLVAVQSILAQAAAPAAWGKPVLILVAVVSLGGMAAAGGWASTRVPDGSGLPVRSPAAPDETEAERIHRLREEVVPKVRDALHGLAFGGGEVVVESAEDYDTRIDITIGFRHRLDHRPGWVSRSRFIHDVDTGRTRVYADYPGTGRFEPVKLDAPIIWFRDPLLGLTLSTPFAPLDRVREILEALPRGQHTAAEARAYRRRLRAALGPYLGTWYRLGNPGRTCAVSFDDNGPVLRDDLTYAVAGYDSFRLSPDGRPVGLVFHGSRVEFSPDGRRIDLPQADDWWTREPLAGGR